MAITSSAHVGSGISTDEYSDDGEFRVVGRDGDGSHGISRYILILLEIRPHTAKHCDYAYQLPCFGDVSKLNCWYRFHLEVELLVSYCPLQQCC